MADSIESLVGDRARDEQGRFKSVTPAEPAKEPAKTDVTPPEVKAVDATPKDVTPPVVPPPAVIPPPVEPPELVGLRQGMIEERRKRQDLERQLQELKQPPKPAVDPWTDLPGALAQQRQEMQAELQKERLLISKDLAREKYKDFEDVIGHFSKAVEANPALAAQMNAHRNPAEFAYRQGLLHRELSTVNGDPMAYRTKLETDLRTKLEAEFAAKYGQKPPPVVPASLNSDTSPAIATEVYAGPPPLNKILRNAKL